jgi:hypothetical protein
MMLPANLNRSTMAAQSRGSVKVLVQPLKLSLLAIATELVSSLSVNTWNSLGPTPVQLHVAELVQAQKINSAVAGNGFRQLSVVGGLHQLVGQLGGEHVLDPVALLCGVGAQSDEQVAFPDAGVADQAIATASRSARDSPSGISGNGRHSSRIRGSKASISDLVAARRYLGGPKLATAFTVFGEQPTTRGLRSTRVTASVLGDALGMVGRPVSTGLRDSWPTVVLSDSMGSGRVNELSTDGC